MAIEMTSHTIISKLNEQLRATVNTLHQQGQQPHLAVVLVGHDPQSELYVSSIKKREAEDLGIGFSIHRLDSNASEERIIETIEQLNHEGSVTGIIVQLPLPQDIDTDRVLNSVSLAKDVDGLRTGSRFIPPTVSAILELLSAYDIDLSNKRIVVVGQGRLVGGPLLKELRRYKLDVTVCDESTTDLAACTINADILISATGEHHLIKPSMVKYGAVVIDVDHEVAYDEVIDKVGYITPQRGGVGPLTVTFLLSNVIEAAQLQAGK